MNSSLHIGRTALLSYQGALQAVGSNISSAGSPDYTRLTPDLSSLQGQFIGGDLQPGAGVALTGILRNVDEALENRVRLSIGAESSAQVQRDALSRLESLLDDQSDAAIGARLRDFFDSFDNLQNTPEDQATRDLAISAGTQLAESLQTLRRQFVETSADLDSQIEDIVVQADELARQIAELNEEITTTEAGADNQAAGLRDQRDALLREIGELFDVTVRAQQDGGVNVYIGSEALVQGAFVRGLHAEQEFDGAFVRTTVRFNDTNAQVEIRGGRLQGLMTSRDQYGIGQVNTIDQIAHALIDQINSIHADGQGLTGFTSVTSATALRATDVALNNPAVGLERTPTNGSFFITVTDEATGTPVAHRIEVDFSDPDNPTTLDSLAQTISDQVDGVAATVAAGNRLSFDAEPGFSFSFGHDGQSARTDTSGVLAALGINTFFTGNDARDINVNNTLQDNPSLLAAAQTMHAGDGTNAGRIAALETTGTALLGGQSIGETYNAFVGAMAVAGRAARDDFEATSSVAQSLKAQRESVSGVNLDEEAISLMRYQRAFQGVSRFVSVVDQLVGELVALI